MADVTVTTEETPPEGDVLAEAAVGAAALSGAAAVTAADAKDTAEGADAKADAAASAANDAGARADAAATTAMTTDQKLDRLVELALAREEREATAPVEPATDAGTKNDDETEETPPKSVEKKIKKKTLADRWYGR